jgi:RNA polymerase sigma factor (sigma-70 family)
LAKSERKWLRLVRAEPRSADPDPLAAVARAASDGNDRAVRTLLVTVGPHLLRVVRQVLGASHPDVDDAVQESAFALVEALSCYRGESTVLHFACRIAVLTAMNLRRREAARKRQAIRDTEFDVESAASPLAPPDAALSARASMEIVRELLDSLPMEQAEVLALHCILGFTMAEIAEAAGAPLETVRSRFRLAKRAVRTRVIGDPRLRRAMEDSS